MPPLTEAQKRAKAKYRQKVKRVTFEIYPTEADIIEQLEKQEHPHAYIKNLIRADIKREG